MVSNRWIAPGCEPDGWVNEAGRFGPGGEGAGRKTDAGGVACAGIAAGAIGWGGAPVAGDGRDDGAAVPDDVAGVVGSAMLTLMRTICPFGGPKPTCEA